jgi:hypothetical protein
VLGKRLFGVMSDSGLDSYRVSCSIDRRMLPLQYVVQVRPFLQPLLHNSCCLLARLQWFHAKRCAAPAELLISEASQQRTRVALRSALGLHCAMFTANTPKRPLYKRATSLRLRPKPGLHQSDGSRSLHLERVGPGIR